MKKRLTITVGIPAYNEEENMEKLIRAVLNQKGKNFILKKILVISDGSTDNTDVIVRKVEKETRKVQLVVDRRRLGKTKRLNQIISLFHSDLLFLIDADTVIKNKLLFSSIIKKADFKRYMVVTFDTTPLKARNFFERIINYSVKIQSDIRKMWKNGSNYLAVKGSFICLNGKFAKCINMPTNLINNDAFFYFKAIQDKKNTKYLPDLRVFYKSPANLCDHIKQSSRYITSQEELKRCFMNLDLASEYKVPMYLVMYISIKYLLTNPILFVCYIFVLVWTRIARIKEVNNIWSPSITTK